tara:strand:+ start:670 stop:1308 length:639 start_codon:yes stop_codon:yes gene_type:complete
MKNIKFKSFILEQPKQLTPEFCKHLINLYETDPKAQETRYAGDVVDSANPLNIKQSEDFYLSKGDFQQEDKILCTALKKLVHNYLTYLEKNVHFKFSDLRNINYQDSGFQMQKTTPGGFYDWHSDSFKTRYFTYIFYLNDIKHKGQTQFANGLKIKPEQGKALIFPGTWEYAHRGIAPTNEIKYIATGWVSAIYEQSDQLQNLELEESTGKL